MSQKIVTISMQNSEGNGFGDPWQILSSTFLKSSVFCYVELTLLEVDDMSPLRAELPSSRRMPKRDTVVAGDTRTGILLDDLWRDLHYAFRTMLKAPLFVCLWF